MSRPSFHDIYMKLALSLAERSTCLRGTKVGCVVTSIDFRKVLAVGYNGNATGLANSCDLTGPEAVGRCGCLHAEENAVINCDVPRDTEKIVFCTHLPCVMCAKRLINLGGVQRIFYENDYRIRDSVALLGKVGILVKPMAVPRANQRIDELVDEWHKTRPGNALHEFLSITREEYDLWVTERTIPAYYLTAASRKA